MRSFCLPFNGTTQGDEGTYCIHQRLVMCVTDVVLSVSLIHPGEMMDIGSGKCKMPIERVHLKSRIRDMVAFLSCPHGG